MTVLHAIDGGEPYVCPCSVVSSRCGARMSQVLIVLSTEPVAITQSLYLHQSVDKISKAWAAMFSVGCGCLRSQTLTVQSPEQLTNTSPCAGFLYHLNSVCVCM